MSDLIWKAITDITDDKEGVSITIFSPNSEWTGHNHRIDVQTLTMNEPLSFYGNDRLAMLQEIKKFVDLNYEGARY